MTERPTPLLSLLALLALAACAAPTPAPEPAPAAPRAPANSSWPYFGGDLSFQRYSPLDQIGPENVDRLRVAWRRPGADASLTEGVERLTVPKYLKATPIYVDGVLYASNSLGLVEAFDPATGRTIWVQEPPERTLAGLAGRSTRGVAFWSDGDDRRILAARGEWLYALDAADGRAVADFGLDGRVNLTPRGARQFNSTAGPIVVDGVVVVGGMVDGAGDGGNDREAVPEDVRGYDVRTGELLWTFHVVPAGGEAGNETWEDGSWKRAGDLGPWCCFSGDPELGHVYVPLSAPTAAWYGGDRPGDNLFANSLVALDARTGRRVWHFQMVHHDVWEYDNVGPPVLGDLTVDGRRIPAVMQPNKNGFLYVLDRRDGRPVWPIEERPVPASDVPGERLSPTQPIPTRPPPFDRQGVGEDDVIDFTPEIRARALEALRGVRLGPLYTPPPLAGVEEAGGVRGVLTVPGAWGAANWNTGAFDPETGIYYAVSHTMPGFYWVSPTTDPEATMEYAWEYDSEYETPNVDGLPVVKPPWGRLTALDLSVGELAWQVANGDGPRDHPLLEDLDLPPLGVANRPAPLLTRTLLFLGEGSDVILGVREGMWGNAFRAYDKATGEVLWRTELPAGVTGAPMTYLHEGKQYIVVAVGDRDHPAEFVALALGDPPAAALQQSPIRRFRPADPPAAAAAQDAPGILCFHPDGPPGVGMEERGGGRRSHVYYRSDRREGVSAGVWEAEPYQTEPFTPDYSEFMYLLEGSVTLVDDRGREHRFRAGDAVVVPRGTTYVWKQEERLRKYWVLFDFGRPERLPPAAGGSPFIRLSPDGPPGIGLAGEGRTRAHRYFEGRGGSSVGVWETAPHSATDFYEPDYAELMIFLEGGATLVEPGGAERTFEPGEVALVPRGARYKWRSDRAKKFWVIFDRGE